MEDNIKQAGNLVRVEFDCCSVATYQKSVNNEWIEWGVDNAHPYFLLALANRNAYHGSILNSKAEYIFGKGLTYNPEELTVEEQAIYENFLNHANPFDSYDDFFRKNCYPLELFNGVAIQISWKVNGKCDVYSMNPGNFRTNKDGSKYYYCEAWVDANGKPNPYPHRHSSFKEFDKFNPQIRTGVQIWFYKVPFLSVVEFEDLYPSPNYKSVIQDIETDIEITNFHYSNLKNGMSASSIVSLFNGEPEPEERKKIAKLFKNHHTGSSNAGKFLLNFVDKGGTPADIKNITTSDMDKMFEILAKRLQQNIFTGHKFDPILGGIMQEGQLGGAKEILEKFDKFMKTYVQYRQQIHLDIIKQIGLLNGVDLDKLEVKQTSPIMETLPSDPAILALFDQATLQDYFSKRYGIEIKDKQVDVAKMEALPINENVKKLTGREYQRLQSLISKYKAGKITYDEAKHFINGYGLGDDYVKLVLGEQKFSSDKDKFVQLFEKYAIDDNEDEVIAEEFVHIKDKVEALENEFKYKFAANNESQVLELLKGDPTLTIEKLAKQLGLDTDVVSEIFNKLIEAGLVVGAIGALSITPKGIARKPVDVEYETYTVYEYVTRPDVPEAQTSRPFCKELLRLSRNGKRWTKEAIDNISNELGDNAWTYRGGFYSNPVTGETTPYCRHIWKSITKTRRKK